MPATPVAGSGASDRGPGDIELTTASEVDADAVRALVEAAPDGILLADERGTILLANRRSEEIFGFEHDGLAGRSVDDLLPQRLRPVHRAHRTRYRADPRLRSMGAGLLLHGRRTDDSEFPVEISLSPMSTGAGLRVVVVVRDISERILAESHERAVRDALDATRDAVLVLDADTLAFTYANEGAVDQVGYSRDELLHMTMLHITPGYTERALRELLGPLASGEQASIMFSTVHRHRDGTDVPVEILMQAIPGDDGRAIRYVKVARDIRERLATEERLRHAEQHLRIVEDRERIARDLHDVVIQKLFAAGMAVQSVAARSADNEHSRRLNRVVDDLDETIREIRSAIFSLNSNTRDESGLRMRLLGVLDDQRAALGFEPRIHFDGPVDATSTNVADAVVAVVREAISNVARHAHASSVDVRVEHRDGFMTVRVVDDGTGVPETPTAGNGILNLSRRAEKLGGECVLTEAISGGTELDWRVPDPG